MTILSIGTDQFMQSDMELLNKAIQIYELPMSTTIGDALCKSQHPLLNFDLSDLQDWIDLSPDEFHNVKFMLACFIMLAHGEEV